MINYMDRIKKMIKNANESKKIKIRIRKKNTDHYSIYLDLWKNNKRSYIYLKRFIKGTKESIISDNEILRYTIAFRDKKEIDLLLNDTGFKLKNSNLSNADFIEYFKSLSLKKKGSTKGKWLSLYRHLHVFSNGKVAINSIDVKFCLSFYNYLNEKGLNTTPKVYYNVFSSALNQLLMDEVIAYNPARKAAKNPEIKIRLQQNKEKPREFLSVEEVKRLIQKPIDNCQTMNAFLFSCFTGLRLIDIRGLTFNDINGNHLYFRQSKTDEDDRMKLHPKALQIINEQKILQSGKSNHIFKLQGNTALNHQIKKWLINANIKKKITFHCARHSFATICLTNDIGIYTVSKLLGHKDIHSTQIYAKLIDKKKDEAIDKLPSFDV